MSNDMCSDSTISTTSTKKAICRATCVQVLQLYAPPNKENQIQCAKSSQMLLVGKIEINALCGLQNNRLRRFFGSNRLISMIIYIAFIFIIIIIHRPLRRSSHNILGSIRAIKLQIGNRSWRKQPTSLEILPKITDFRYVSRYFFLSNCVQFI